MTHGQQPKVLMLISGGETGGSRKHVLSLLERLAACIPVHLVCLMQGPVYDEAIAKGLPVSLLQQASRRDMRVIEALSRRIGEEGFTHLHSHGGRANFVAAVLKRRWRKTHASSPLRFLTTIHSDIYRDYIHQPGWKRWLFTRLNLWALRRFDHYIAVSQAFARQLEADGFPSGRISVVYNGIDLEQPVPPYTRQQLSDLSGLRFEERDLILTMVGRLHPVKEIPVFLHSFSRLLQEGWPLKALLVGDGPERERLQELIRTLQLEPHVALLGFRQDVEALLGASDLSVLTSRSESFPFVILESIKAGTPVVATQVGGIPDLLPEECLFQPGDVEGLAAVLKRLLGQPQRLCELASELRQRVSREFSLQALTDKHLEIYKRVMTLSETT
jgi:glycosyltransferase involved in cell wall biosynthesis